LIQGRRTAEYNALPHLVVAVVNDPKKVILALRWVVNEMESATRFLPGRRAEHQIINERPKGRPLRNPSRNCRSKPGRKSEAGADGFAVEVDEDRRPARQ